MGEQIELIPTEPAFRTTMFDPPWQEHGGGKSKRGCDRHYPTLPTREIPRVIMSAPNWRPAVNAHCWEWTTNTFLPDALWVMERVGFRYVTNVVWVKLDIARLPKIILQRVLTQLPIADVFSSESIFAAFGKMPAEEILYALLQMGLGQYFRGAHELLLFGVRGEGQSENLITEARNIPSVIFGKRGRHSAKCDNSYKLIERRSKGPYSEIFSRSRREGWESFGNQLTEFVPNDSGDPT